MATYTLIPSSWEGTSLTNPENAYHDTTNETQYVVGDASATGIFLGGFDFSVIPTGWIVSDMSIKVRGNRGSDLYTANSYQMAVFSAPDGYALSESVNAPTSGVVTFTLTASVETILSYAETLCIKFYSIFCVYRELIC